MKISDNIKMIDWENENNKAIGLRLLADAKEYWERVEAHIYKGNEIRGDLFMDFSEKQEEIATLDRKRTNAHNKMLESFKPFLDLLKTETEFNADEYKLDNRTQIADFIASIAFELMGAEPASRIEGNVRDELAEKLHNKEFTFEQIEQKL